MPISVFVRTEHGPIVELGQLLRRELAAVLDRLAELVDAPNSVAVIGLVYLQVVGPDFLLNESVKIGDDEGDFFG